MSEQPDPNASPATLENWELRIVALDQRLRPIASRQVDITRPGWAERLVAGTPPLDESGVREQAQQLLAELIAAYAGYGEETRSVIRRLFAQSRSFAWAASLSTPWTTADGFRQHLILFSIQDQGQDSRDALLMLQCLCGEAATAGVDTGMVLRQVAAMSSGANRYRMGSTRDMLMKHCS